MRPSTGQLKNHQKLKIWLYFALWRLNWSFFKFFESISGSAVCFYSLDWYFKCFIRWKISAEIFTVWYLGMPHTVCGVLVNAYCISRNNFKRRRWSFSHFYQMSIKTAIFVRLSLWKLKFLKNAHVWYVGNFVRKNHFAVVHCSFESLVIEISSTESLANNDFVDTTGYPRHTVLPLMLLKNFHSA